MPHSVDNCASIDQRNEEGVSTWNRQLLERECSPTLCQRHTPAVRRSIKATEKGFHLKEAVVVGAGMITQSQTEPTEEREKHIHPSFAMQNKTKKKQAQSKMIYSYSSKSLPLVSFGESHPSIRPRHAPTSPETSGTISTRIPSAFSGEISRSTAMSSELFEEPTGPTTPTNFPGSILKSMSSRTRPASVAREHTPHKREQELTKTKQNAT